MTEKSINLLDIAGVISYIILVSNERGIDLTQTKDKNVAVDFNNQFKEVEAWVNKKGYKVLLKTDVEDQIAWDEKAIYINSRNRPENKYYTLLHECGHLLIAQAAKQWEKDVPMYACVADARIAKSKAYRVSLVAEEIEAWKRGRRLAGRLKHHINNEKYDKQITECVFSYIEAAALEY